MSFRRTASVLGTTLVAAAVTAAPAFAGNAHFIGSGTSASASGATLTVKFKEAGLESGSTETIQVSAHLDATYQCVNGGGKVPSDPKKTTISSDVSQSGQFTAAKNGNLTGSLSVSAPAPSSVLSCPGGQESTLTSAVWTQVVVSDLTSGASMALPGTFTG